MKPILFFFTLLTGLLTFAACNTSNSQKEERIVTTIPPLQYLAEAIVKDSLPVECLVPEGMAPEIYEPNAQQMSQLYNSTTLIATGLLSFEKQLYRGAKENNNNLKIINISQNITPVRGPDFVHGDHIHQGETDPHVWCSPKQMLIAAKSCYEHLCQQYPQYRNYFSANFTKLENEILELHQLAETTFATQQKRDFLIFHPTLTYFANDYNLKQIAIEVDGKEPSIKQVQDIIQMARNSQLKHIFVQKEFTMKSLDNIAKEFGGSIITIDPLSKHWDKEIRNTIKQLHRSFSMVTDE